MHWECRERRGEEMQDGSRCVTEKSTGVEKLPNRKSVIEGKRENQRPGNEFEEAGKERGLQSRQSSLRAHLTLI